MKKVFDLGRVIEIDWRYGWYVLAYAILSPTYCCPEKAFITFFEGKKVNVIQWMTEDMIEEMKNIKKEIGGKKTAECYGISLREAYRLIRGK